MAGFGGPERTAFTMMAHVPTTTTSIANITIRRISLSVLSFMA
jgi:hypothetical protein